MAPDLGRASGASIRDANISCFDARGPTLGFLKEKREGLFCSTLRGATDTVRGHDKTISPFRGFLDVAGGGRFFYPSAEGAL